MGKIDSDYLWLQERPQSPSYLRRIALLLLIPLIVGAAWLSTAPESQSAGDRERGTENNQRTVPLQASIDAQIGAPHRNPGPRATNQTATANAPGNDIALDETRDGAVEIPASPVDDNAHRLQEEPARLLVESKGALADTSMTDAGFDAAQSQHSSKRAAGADRDTTTPAATGWHDFTVQTGDTLSIAFNRNGLSYADSLKIAHMSDYGSRFTRGLQAGDILKVRSNRDGNVLALDYPIDALHTLEVRPDGDDGFSGEIVLTDVEHRKAYATGVIDTSFYVDALEAGLSDNQIMQLVKIFGWDIDFALDIRPGDRFVVVYDELYRDGEKLANGNILAASFVNHGNAVRAVRYTRPDDESAYYSPSGRQMKKAFIRTPVDYTRISSGFSLARKHPILNRIRRHTGTDYAAPSGTPIKAAGNGRIVFRGRRGGYGNMIIIRHDSHLTTRYGHMSRFAKGFGVGSKIKQGQVIGYVGMTGLATGPHLHYEFRVDGKPKDPEKVTLPKALPLPRQYMADFKQRTAPLLSQLDTLSHTNVARADTNDHSHTD